MNTIILMCFHYLISTVLFEILHKFEIQIEYHSSKIKLKFIFNKEINAFFFYYFFRKRLFNIYVTHRKTLNIHARQMSKVIAYDLK
jgi:hypothetical protein